MNRQTQLFFNDIIYKKTTVTMVRFLFFLIIFEKIYVQILKDHIYKNARKKQPSNSFSDINQNMVVLRLQSIYVLYDYSLLIMIIY